MSLQTKLTALAQAVGADIKALNAKVATASAFNVKVKPTADWAITAAQTNVPGLTVTVTEAGQYLVIFAADLSIAPANGYIIAFPAVNGVVPVSSSEAAVKQVYATDVNARFPFGREWLITANAGDVITIQMSNGGSSGNNISSVHSSMIVARTGGVKGDKGDLGGVLGANSFRQLAASAPGPTSNWRTIWVSATNEMDPVGAFTRNADGSITIRDAGWYSVSATFRVATVAALCTFALTDTLNAPGNPFCVDTKSLSPNYSNSMGADNYFAAGAKIYPNVWTDVVTQIELTYFAISRLGGTKGDKGDKGDPGYALMSAIGGAAYVNAAAGWNQLPFDPAAVMSTTDGTPDFTRNASGSITFNKAGTYDISATMGNASAAQSTTSTMDCRLIVGSVGVVNPDTSVNALTVERRQAVAGDYTICSLSGQVTVVPGQSLAAWLFVGVAVNGVAVSHFGITRQGGPQGPKGDPGGINVLTTLDWNTATTSNFYKSTNDFMQKTLHGPGDTLNPPNQAGIVTAHDSGELTQRVWDLDYEVSYTRYRRSDNTWTAWAADLTKPPVLTGLIVGAPTPVDGDERFFQTAAMAAMGVMWRFRYNKNSTSTYKWEFVGGGWLSAENQAGGTVGPSAGFAALGGTSFTIPLDGEYALHYGSHWALAAGESARVAPTYGAAASVAEGTVLYGSSSNIDADLSRLLPKRTITGGTVASLQYILNATVARGITAIWFQAQPLRVNM